MQALDRGAGQDFGVRDDPNDELNAIEAEPIRDLGDACGNCSRANPQGESNLFGGPALGQQTEDLPLAPRECRSQSCAPAAGRHYGDL